MDATAAQTFGTMCNSLRRQGVELVLTFNQQKSMQRLLEAHGLISSTGDGKDGTCRQDLLSALSWMQTCFALQVLLLSCMCARCHCRLWLCKQASQIWSDCTSLMTCGYA